jgi:hypothetical protein
MIIRKGDGPGLVLIGQTDHSRFVGQLAAHWGNREVATPQPYTPVVRAATFHDFGWLRYETSPLLDAGSGEPYQFLQVPMTDAQLGAYQWALDWMSAIDPYSGLIVSMHRTGLWRGRYGVMKHPAGYSLNVPAVRNPAVEQFVERNEAAQRAQRAAFDDDGVWINYRLMQVWDLLGLYFCCQDAYEDVIDPVPVSYEDRDGGVRMALTPRGNGQVQFDPYPFDVRPCRVQLVTRRLTQRRFADEEAFRRAYFGAEVELLTFELV